MRIVGSRPYAAGRGPWAAGRGPYAVCGVSVSPCLRGEKTRRAFTLVELLVVIVIIGILAGLITAAAVPAFRAAKQMTIIGEISQLTMAMERYKQEHGEYPPDFCGVNSTDATVQATARAAVLRHLRTAFPRYRPGIKGSTNADPWERFRDDLQKSCGIDPNNLDAASALVFWLGGPSSRGGTTRLAGFSTDPTNPFQINEDSNGNGTLDTSLDLDGDGSADDDEDIDGPTGNGDGEIDSGGSHTEPFFEFAEERLVLTDGIYRYQPPHVQDPDGGPDAPPYVYFRARNNAYDSAVQQFAWPLGAPTTLCVPYGKDSDGSLITQWFNPNTCQIICCGLDGWYAKENDSNAVRYLKLNGQLGGNLEPEEDDNLTNFSKGALGDWNEGK